MNGWRAWRKQWGMCSPASGIPQVASSTDAVEVVFELRHAAVLQG